MAAQRRLSAEVERCLKKAKEGLELLDSLWERREQALAGSEGTDDHGKDRVAKADAELKKEIKKLQKCRDTVRGFLSSSDSKDYWGKLEIAKRKIEEHMENFKEAERQSKIKAFSKEALSQPDKPRDPSSQQKIETMDWLRDTIDTLEEMTELVEGELETLSSAKAKKRQSSKIKVLNDRLDAHKFHIVHLQQVLRLVENDEISPEEASDTLKTSLEYYIESHADEDFMPDDELYDELCSHVDTSVGQIEEHAHKHATGTDSSKKKEEKGHSTDVSPDHKHSERSSSHATSSAKDKVTKSSSHLQATEESSSSSSSSHATSNKGKQSALPAKTSKSDKTHSTPSPSTPTGSSAASGAVPTPSPKLQTSAWTRDEPNNSKVDKLPSAPAEEKAIPVNRSSHVAGAHATHDAVAKHTNTIYLRKMEQLLSNAAQSLPRETDSNVRPHDKRWPPCPHPVPQDYVPASFPSAAPAPLKLRDILSKMPLDTLFFAFYHQSGTYAAYIATLELRRLGWRYHTKYKTWFQRYREPIAVTERYEESDMIYFDYSPDGWVQRLKPSFGFEYIYLEDTVLAPSD